MGWESAGRERLVNIYRLWTIAGTNTGVRESTRVHSVRVSEALPVRCARGEMQGTS